MTFSYRSLLTRLKWPLSLWLLLTLGLLGFVWYGLATGLENWLFVKQVLFFYVLDSVLLFVSATHFPTLKIVMINYVAILGIFIASFFLLRAVNILQ